MSLRRRRVRGLMGLAALLLALLPPDVREVIAGDLEEAWNAQPSRLRYWRMVLGSLAACRKIHLLSRNLSIFDP